MNAIIITFMKLALLVQRCCTLHSEFFWRFMLDGFPALRSHFDVAKESGKRVRA
jgi:hypothetical protein